MLSNGVFHGVLQQRGVVRVADEDDSCAFHVDRAYMLVRFHVKE